MQLPLHCVRKPEFWPNYHPSSTLPSPPVPTEGVDYPVNTLVEVAAEQVVLGKDLAFPNFGWDNEYGRKDVNVAAFRCAAACRVPRAAWACARLKAALPGRGRPSAHAAADEQRRSAALRPPNATGIGHDGCPWVSTEQLDHACNICDAPCPACLPG